MGERLDGEDMTADDFNHLFDRFAHTAFRLETRPVYLVAEEAESYAEFLTAEPRTALTPPTEYPFYAAWSGEVRRATAQGRRVHRVRVLDVPPTDYQRWEIWIAQFALEAGESIQYLDRPRAERLDLPTDVDWWLFDDEALALMRFADDGTPLGGHVVTDERIVAQHCT